MESNMFPTRLHWFLLFCFVVMSGLLLQSQAGNSTCTFIYLFFWNLVNPRGKQRGRSVMSGCENCFCFICTALLCFALFSTSSFLYSVVPPRPLCCFSLPLHHVCTFRLNAVFLVCPPSVPPSPRLPVLLFCSFSITLSSCSLPDVLVGFCSLVCIHWVSAATAADTTPLVLSTHTRAHTHVHTHHPITWESPEQSTTARLIVVPAACERKSVCVRLSLWISFHFRPCQGEIMSNAPSADNHWGRRTHTHFFVQLHCKN